MTRATDPGHGLLPIGLERSGEAVHPLPEGAIGAHIVRICSGQGILVQYNRVAVSREPHGEQALRQRRETVRGKVEIVSDLR